jgi:hypothetical protein
MLGATPGYGGPLPSGGRAPGAGPTVYWGTQPAPIKMPKRGIIDIGGTRDDLDDGSRGEAMLLDLDDRSRVRSELIKNGIIDPKTELRSGTIDEVWAMAMQFSASAYAKGKKLTPWDILRLMKGGGAGGGGWGGGGGAAAFSGTRTTTSRDVVLSDKKTAKALIESVLQDQLGRDPSEDEYDAFVNNLHREEKANPVVTTTSTTYKAGQAVSSSSTRKGGLDAPGKQEVVEERLEESPQLKREREAQRKARYVSIIEQMNGGVDL